MNGNQSVLAGLKDFHFKLYSDWHHKALPNGEYPKAVDELLSAYPEITKYRDVEKRISQYTNQEAVMVKLKQGKAGK